MSSCSFCKRHILVVDDDALVCETVTMVLQLDGHFVDTASSGAQALDLFQPGKFDLIITDFFMPAMCGDQLAAAIKSRSPNQMVMMLTAYPEKICRDRPAAMVDMLMCKPFEIQDLRNAITRCAPDQARAGAPARG